MKLKPTLRIIRDRILWEKFFFNRGKSIYSDFFELLTITTVVGGFLTLLNYNLHTNFEVGKVMAFVPIVLVVYWLTGRLDYKKIHLIQKENEIAMESNPALYKKICRIDNELKKQKKLRKAKKL